MSQVATQITAPELSKNLAIPQSYKRTVDHTRIPELDGIRAIAIWMVLVGHVFYGWTRSDHDFSPIPPFVMLLIGHGWLGVDLFFILSGFLITGILLDSKGRVHYFRNFYVRRVLRIMPLYFAALFIFIACYHNYGPFFALSALFAANLDQLFNIKVPHGPGVLWSLAVEEHFYLVWPLLVYVLNRKNLAILSIFIVALTPVARGLAVTYGMPIDTAVYSYSWFRFDGLALGALIALWVRSSYAEQASTYKLAGLLVILAAAITIGGAPFGISQTHSALGAAFRFTQAQLPFAAFILVVLALKESRLTAILRSPIARLTAGLSFCLYLIHLAIGDAYQAAIRSFGIRPDLMFGDLGAILIRGVFIILTSYGIASLSKKYLEEPFLQLKRLF